MKAKQRTAQRRTGHFRSLSGCRGSLGDDARAGICSRLRLRRGRCVVGGALREAVAVVAAARRAPPSADCRGRRSRASRETAGAHEEIGIRQESMGQGHAGWEEGQRQHHGMSWGVSRLARSVGACGGAWWGSLNGRVVRCEGGAGSGPAGPATPQAPSSPPALRRGPSAASSGARPVGALGEPLASQAAFHRDTRRRNGPQRFVECYPRPEVRSARSSQCAALPAGVSFGRGAFHPASPCLATGSSGGSREPESVEQVVGRHGLPQGRSQDRQMRMPPNPQRRGCLLWTSLCTAKVTSYALARSGCAPLVEPRLWQALASRATEGLGSLSLTEARHARLSRSGTPSVICHVAFVLVGQLGRSEARSV